MQYLEKLNTQVKILMEIFYQGQNWNWAILQAISRQLAILVQMEIVINRMTLRQDFLRALQFFIAINHSANFPYCHFPGGLRHS
jgi:hypothetical protein